jgi:hypothetical protein
VDFHVVAITDGASKVHNVVVCDSCGTPRTAKGEKAVIVVAMKASSPQDANQKMLRIMATWALNGSLSEDQKSLARAADPDSKFITPK